MNFISLKEELTYVLLAQHYFHISEKSWRGLFSIELFSIYFTQMHHEQSKVTIDRCRNLLRGALSADI